MKTIIRKSYETELMNLINQNGGSCDSPEDIWSNLKYLANKVTKFNDTLLYLPLQIKKMLAYIVDPDYRIEYTVQKAENVCTVEAFFYWSDKEYPAGKSFVKRFISQVYPDHAMTAEERESVFEATVRGLAASRAITDAGIGLQIYGDCFDMSLDQQEETETSNQQQQEAEGKVPEIPSNNDKKQQKREAAAKKTAKENASAKEKEENKTKPEEKPVEVPSVSSNEPVTEEETGSNETVDLTDALAQIADMGTFTGYPLGEILEKMPYNIAWLANNAASKVRSAARAIAMSDPNLAKKVK